MAKGRTGTAICWYRVQKGKEDDFLGALARHWPALKAHGLVGDEPSRIYRGEDESGKTFFVELLDWKDVEEGPKVAEQTPEIMAIWESMGKLTEARLGRPPMEFPHAFPVKVASATK